ncbi:MAG: cytochrome P450, partial [Acidimicrobiia bacterium]|nr:cytochrome P450 [Acidimicrobiia bacterium]
MVVNRSLAAPDPVGYDPLAPHVQEDPYPYYERLLADHPLYYSSARDVWALCRYGDLRPALKDWQTFSSAEGVNLEPGFSETIGPEILNMDPPRHDQLRRLVSHHFSNSSVGSYEPLVRAFAHELIDGLCADGGGDFAGDFSQRLPVLVICRLMGIPLSDEATVRQLAHDMLLALSGTDEFNDVSAAAAEELRRYMGELVTDRRRSPRDDVISSLAAGKIDGEPIGAEEMFSMCLIIYLAGNTTTSALVSNGLYLLAQHPDQQARLAESPEAVAGAVEEMLRYESPVQWTS